MTEVLMVLFQYGLPISAVLVGVALFGNTDLGSALIERLRRDVESDKKLDRILLELEQLRGDVIDLQDQVPGASRHRALPGDTPTPPSS